LNISNWTHRPFSPARCPFFYGWAVLVFGALGMIMSMPGQTIGVSAFVEHLITALGLTREQLSRAYMFGTLGSGFLIPYAGKLYDRFGVRVVAPAASVGLGMVLLLLSRADRISRHIASALDFLKPGAVTLGVMVAGFFLLRFFGQGVLTISSRNMVLKWFQRYRGLVNGILAIVFALSVSLTPRLLDALITCWGWSGAWCMLGLFIGIGFAFLALLVYRDNPEAYGLVPDGKPLPADSTKQKAVHLHDVHRPFTLRQARRTFAFWAFTATLCMSGLFGTGMIFQIVSIFKQAGMGKNSAFAIFLPISLVSVSVLLAGSYLSDRIKLKYLLVAMCGALLASMLGLILLGPRWTIWLIIVARGATNGLSGLLTGLVWPTFYGRKHLGAISGFAMAIPICGSAIGPWLFSQSLAFTGSYYAITVVCSILTLFLFVASFWANNPQQRLAESPSSWGV